MRVSLSDLALAETVFLFEGREHGAQISFFVVRFPPGRGPGAHRHPYEETFVVQAGEATFTVDGEAVVARAGEIVVVPAGTAHGFVAGGESELSLVSIHPSDHIVQERL